MILQGNTYYLEVQIYDEDDNLIVFDDIDTVEFCFGKKVTKMYPSESVEYNQSDSKFVVHLSQEDTFSMTDDIEYQFRVKYKDGQVKGTIPTWINVTESISKEIL